MKEAPPLQSLYIGIDVSKSTLDVSSLSQGGDHDYRQFENSKAGLQKLNRWLLQQEGFAFNNALFCMEHTGIYTRRLVEFLLTQSAKVWMESAQHLLQKLPARRLLSALGHC